MTIHELDNDSMDFIMQLRSVSEEIALWASEKLIQGFPLDEIKYALADAAASEIENRGEVHDLLH
jgi:hypothetical protein